jgi:DNA polymerase
MTDDRAGGPTFALQDICWIDFETKSKTNIKAGTYRYACDADAIVLAYAIGDGPVRTISVPDFNRPLIWNDDAPPDLIAFCKRVQRGEAIFAAWNAGFDRAVWNYSALLFPEMLPHHIIDVMAQAVASGLPPDLNYAAKFSGSTHKIDAGKSLISLFCIGATATGTPQNNPAEWAEFLNYAKGDIVAMRDIFLRTRQLPLAEWKEYWAIEAINARGIGIDLEMVKTAAALAEQDRERSRQELTELTGGAVTSVDQVKRMVKWLLERLPPAGRDILLKREAEIDEETGEEKIPAEFNLTRKQVERLIAFNEDDTIDRVLQIRLYGGSKTPTKFAKMLQQHVDGVLFGQYVFNGAAQTGRASSKGVQIHNLARDTLPYEHDAIEALLATKSYDDFCSVGDDSPVSRKLSLLIRPAFVPRETNLFVWSDWSQIEARVLPWLCDHMSGAAARLELFRAVDADPSVPDLYTRTAAELSHLPVSEVTREARQRGKVAELALGFCGGKNALQAMAAAYGMHLDDAEALAIVDRWRAANPWAVNYSRQLWNAMECARATAGYRILAGRVGFCWLPQYLGGSLLCQLPSGRFLTYRAMRHEMVDKKDDKGVVIGQQRELTYARGHGRAKLWPGIFVENVTQAVAADILRGTLVRLEKGTGDDGNFPVRLHSHDEVLIEVPEARAGNAAWLLGNIMRTGFDWSKGLPLMSEETIAPYYSKRA